MQYRRTRRFLAVAVAALVGVLSTVQPSSAVGDGNPVILAPEDAFQYEGFDGPYVVDFDNAPAGTYTWSVVRFENSEPIVVVAPQQFVWTGAEQNPVTFQTPVVPAGVDYIFRVTDGEGHQAAVGFEVRDYPQPHCYLVAPTKVRVAGPETDVHARLHSNCLGVEYASWDVKHVSHGFYSTYQFDHATKDFWTYFDNDALGTYVAVPADALNLAGDRIVQNRAPMTFRLDARVALTAVRDGADLVLKTTLTKYSRTANKFGPWGKHGVVLSSRACQSCPWKLIGTPITTRSGKTSTRFRYPGVREYRVTSPGESFVWAPYAKYWKG